MKSPCPWLNTSPEQENAWHGQRIAALAAHRQALIDVMRLRDVEARRRFMLITASNGAN